MTMYSSVPVKSSIVSKGPTANTDYWIKRRYVPPKFGNSCWSIFCRELYWTFRRIQFRLCYYPDDTEIEEFDLNTIRHRPVSLASLCDSTAFSKQEIRLMYRGFKQFCPNGIVTFDQFREIYLQFFPSGGDSSQYAQYVFNTFDVDRNGQISFEEFCHGLSVISRGTLTQKLEWVFTLYDTDQHEFLTKHDLTLVISSMYLIMGNSTVNPANDDTVMQHVEDIHKKLSTNPAKEIISKDDFMFACKNDQTIVTSLILFDTMIHNLPGDLSRKPGDK